MSSMYQLQGSSTRVFEVGGAGVGRGFIHDDADTEAEKSMGFMAGREGRK